MNRSQRFKGMGIKGWLRPKWFWYAQAHREERRYRGAFKRWAAAFHRR